jgi:type II secretory ATPase GspE/PulE/Tfp pilus assembly ATPase PilB-like protein
VLRFLDPSRGITTFNELGFTERTYEMLKKNLEKNTGITIFTGPTGS